MRYYPAHPVHVSGLLWLWPGPTPNFCVKKLLFIYFQFLVDMCFYLFASIATSLLIIFGLNNTRCWHVFLYICGWAGLTLVNVAVQIMRIPEGYWVVLCCVMLCAFISLAIVLPILLMQLYCLNSCCVPGWLNKCYEMWLNRCLMT